jgi:acetylornithine deacetylase/succinyl-diaminopimelate desuccinylase-like protein
MAGAASANAIPQTATATLKGGDLPQWPRSWKRQDRPSSRSTNRQGGKFGIDIAQGADSIEVKVTGVSAHGSRPEEGVNPLPRLALFLQESGAPLASNHYLKAVKYIDALYGTGYLGEKMGLGYKDDFMGPLTLSPNLIREKDGKLEVTANVRMPRGNTPDELKSQVNGEGQLPGPRQTRPSWTSTTTRATGWPATPRVRGCRHCSTSSADTTGLEARPVPTAGSTTAKLMPNAINFGPAMPGKKYTAHNAKEYKEVPTSMPTCRCSPRCWCASAT